jgi:hypothetical protein
MPIKKKDRSFQNIVREIEIDQVPVEYIDTLTVVLQNGDRVLFEGEDLEDIEADNIVGCIMAVADELGDEHGSNIENIEIVVNYADLEQDVSEKVNKLLNKKDDSSNTSL